MKIGMIAAMPKELETFLSRTGTPDGAESIRGYEIKKYRINDNMVFITGSGAGEIAAAAAAQMLITKYDVDMIINFGVVGGLTEGMSLTKAVVIERLSEYIKEKTDHRTAVITCLALEEMLTAIAMANGDRKDFIDVMLRQTDNDIIISIRDMGTGFNPLVRDESLACDFDNVTVLQSIASEIRYDLSLGMNDTMIRLSGKKKGILSEAK